MKKSKLIIGCLAMAFASLGIAACGDETVGGDPTDDPSVQPPQTQIYTVKFESAWGGVFSDQSVESGKTAQTPTMPDRLGWNFDGWFLNGVQYDFNTAVTGDITLVARFTSVLGGAGTVADPFTVDNADELALVKSYIDGGSTEFINAAYVQTADITSTLTAAMSSFAGVYDGGGYSLVLTAPLFGELGGTVKNIDASGNIDGAFDSVGLIANKASATALITDVQVSGNITNSRGVAGGVVGALNGGRIERVRSAVSVSGGIAGGIAGDSAGVVINSIAQSAVSGSTAAGGAVGSLQTGGLIQNVGAGGAGAGAFVSAVGGDAGGIVGVKQSGSSVYRAFVYGTSVNGAYAGGIVGRFADNGVYYTDISQSFVLNTLNITGSTAVTQASGQTTASDFADMTLPSAVWDMSGNIPALKAEPSRTPAMLDITMDGEETQVRYGSHVGGGEIFDADDIHFSALIELDGSVELKTVVRTNDVFGGWEFVSANDELGFAANGGTIKIGSTAANALSYVLTYAHTESFRYLPDIQDPSSGYDVDYAAPVSVYTDGEKYYAFVLTKQQIAASNYIGYLDSFVLTDGEWRHASTWAPKSVLPAGAYRYDIPRPFQTPLTYAVIVDGNYRVDGNEGYYLTRFVSRVEDEDNVTESLPIVGRGYGIISLGDSEDNAPVAAFSFTVDNEGYSDFVYFDEQGDLVNSIGLAVTDATNTFIGGKWFDGERKYTFDTSSQMIDIEQNGDTFNVPYVISEGKVKFTIGNDLFSLVLAPTEFGTYKFVKSNGDEFYMASYISGALNGRWITESGDIIVVSDSPSASVTLNGVNAEANEALYNGVQAVRFTTGGKEHHLIVYKERGVAVLAVDGREQYAFEHSAIERAFAGEFVSAVNGERRELSVSEELAVQITVGAGDPISGNAVPVKSENGYVLKVTLGTDEYELSRVGDVITVKQGDSVTVYTDSAMFARFVGEYSNGAETLVITEDGTFARFERNGATGEYTALTAKFREERYEYGLEKRGFVLTYTDGTTEYFFYADADARNVRLYRAWVNSVGNDTATLITNFVPESELQPIYGRYSRMFNGEVDALEFNEDGTLTRSYTDAAGVRHDGVEITWYPVLNYNSQSQTSTIMAYTYESEDGVGFTNHIDFNVSGLVWGMNEYVSEGGVAQDILEYGELLFVANDNGASLTLTASQLKLKKLVNSDGTYSEVTSYYYFDGIVKNADGSIVISMSNGPDTATAVLNKNGNVHTVSLAQGGETAKTFTGEQPLDYNTLVGEYDCEGVGYALTAEEFWGSVSVQLKISNVSRAYTYSTSNGVTIMSDGTRALMFTNYYNSSTTKYVWKDGDYLMVSDSLDASGAIAALDAAVSGMPTLDQVKEMLGGNEFIADDGSTVSFEYVSGTFGYLEMSDGTGSAYLDDDGHTKGKGYYILLFGVTDMASDFERYVKVFINDNGAITKLLIGETEATATKEYLPNVDVVYPTVDELLAQLKDMSYKAADGAVVSFSELWGAYSIDIGGTLYDYVKNSGSLSGDTYTLNFKPTLGSSVKTVTIVYGTNGVEKVSVGGKDYMPIPPPTIDELKTSLDGATFSDGAGKRLTFSVDSLFGYFNIELYNGETRTGIGSYKDEYIANGNTYTLTFDDYPSKSYSVKIAFDAMGKVQTVTVDSVIYLPMPTAEELLDDLDEVTFANADQTQTLVFAVYPDFFGGSPTYSVTIGDNEYNFTDGSAEGMVYTLNFESDMDGTIAELIITLGYDSSIVKITYDGVDYTR